MGDDSSRNLLPYSSNDFLLPSFVEQVDDFSDLISGEIDYPSLDCGFVGGSNNTVSCGVGDMFHLGGCNDDSNSLLMDGILNQLDEGAKNGEDDDEDNDDDSQSSSATTTTLSTPTKKKTSNKVDRSTTLISERRRRGRMKEKLYALRSLVPNITKMDKASIIGDAVFYVQDLQIQAKKLKAEIAGLEASLSGAKRHQQQDTEEDQGETPENRPNKRTQHVSNPIHHTTTSRKILKMDVFQVEEGGFYTRLVCSRGVGVAVSLYKALESLTTFNIESSNLASASPDRFVLTFSLSMKEGEQRGMNLESMKVWITGALLTQGFELGISC